MGGNSKAIDILTGEIKSFNGRYAYAERIDLKKVNANSLRSDIVRTLLNVADTFFERFNRRIWPATTNFSKGHCFMGSSRHLYERAEDLTRYMPTIGDIDVAVPEENLSDLWEHLCLLESEDGWDEMKYLGQNRQKLRRPSINAVFLWNGLFLQIDFVGTRIDEKTGDVDRFVRFAHSSSWEDRVEGIKGVAHKYLLQTLAWSVSYDSRVIILTDKSPLSPQSKIRIKTMHEPPRPMSFSVDRGMRMRLAQQFEPCGKPLIVNGQNAYKEVPTSQSKYITNLEEIFEMLFGQLPVDNDLNEFESFQGLIRLSKKYLDNAVMERALAFLICFKLFGNGQALSRDSADDDRRVKERICEVIKDMTMVKVDQALIRDYYDSYREREVDE